MPVANGTEPVSDEELLYRRIPASASWYDPNQDPALSPEAFRPNRNDVTGLSVSRAKYKSIEKAGSGQEGKRYYVAVIRAGDLRAHNIRIVPRPQAGDPGHAELPDMTYDNRHSDQVLEWKATLALKLCLRVEGPFGPEAAK